MRSRLLILLALLVFCAAAYVAIGARGDLGFILALRGQKLLALLLVAVAIATSTILFQTITGNRILTPSIMGFDALYLLLLSALIWSLGASTYQVFPPQAMMLANVGLLCGAAVLLFTLVLRASDRDLMRMILTGVVLSVLFRSLTAFLQRTIDPNEYAVIQAVSFARFSQVQLDLLGLGTALMVCALWAAWQMRHRFDVLALGSVNATSLGENPLKLQRQGLLIISILVSVSTALVGPVAFFGLLISALTYQLVPSSRHGDLLPAAAMIAAIVLVAGQTVMERMLNLTTPLSVVVEFVGGLVFLFLLLRGFGR